MESRTSRIESPRTEAPGIPRRTSTPPRAAVAALAIVAAGLWGCASWSGRPDRVALEPRGPGSVFTTIEDAVVDAMAFSVNDARRSGRADRMYGGVITMVDEGYTYQAPAVAKAWRPLEIRYRITGRDVARYHVYPVARDLQENQRREGATRWDRQSVDEQDPRRRTLYFLTPSRIVKAYHGERFPVQALARLDRADDGLLFVHNGASLP